MEKDRKVGQRTYSIINLATVKKELLELWKKEKPKDYNNKFDNDVINFVIDTLFKQAVNIESEKHVTQADIIMQKSPNELKMKVYDDAMKDISNSLSKFMSVYEYANPKAGLVSWKFSLMLLPLCHVKKD